METKNSTKIKHKTGKMNTDDKQGARSGKKRFSLSLFVLLMAMAVIPILITILIIVAIIIIKNAYISKYNFIHS